MEGRQVLPAHTRTGGKLCSTLWKGRSEETRPTRLNHIPSSDRPCTAAHSARQTQPCSLAPSL
eukprot:1950311-Rhodomonas_salina.1